MGVHPHRARPIPRSNRIKTSYPALALSERVCYYQPMETQVVLSPPHRSICCLTPLWVQSLPRTRYGGHALVAASGRSVRTFAPSAGSRAFQSPVSLLHRQSSNVPRNSFNSASQTRRRCIVYRAPQLRSEAK